MALAFDEQGKVELAEHAFKSALQIHPNQADILGDYANFLRNSKRELDKAEKTHKKSVKNSRCCGKGPFWIKERNHCFRILPYRF